MLFSKSMATILVVLLALTYHANVGDSEENCDMYVCSDIKHGSGCCKDYTCKSYNKGYYYAGRCRKN